METATANPVTLRTTLALFCLKTMIVGGRVAACHLGHLMIPSLDSDEIVTMS